MITDINQLDLNKRYTYADYLTWKFDETVELIQGRAFPVLSSPNRRHQGVRGNLTGALYSIFKAKKCEMYAAPFDVKLPLPPDGVDDTVVQPDICIVCDLDKLTDRGCTGAPDWIIEILSPGTSHKDLNEKFEVYQHAGVGEYWVVHPHEHTVQVFSLNEQGVFESVRVRPYAAPDTIHSVLFPEVALDLAWVFAE